jgi:ABC-2 type transport system permease protein
MTATTAQRRPAHPAHATPGPGSPFTGTGALLRLNLRLDRFRILAWTLAVGLGVYGSVVALDEAYPTDASLQSRGALLANPATIMMTGPAFAADDYTFGAMVANELALYVFLALGMMSILLAVRHTRAEEESGRLELLRSLPVGRFAPSTAAVTTVAIANVLVGAATTLALLAPTGGRDLPVEDSIAFGAATALTGMVFAGLATVAAQLTEHARSATGVAMAALAVAYLVRGVGDVIHHTGSWLSWCSPFAWAQQTRVFVDLRWWPLAVTAVRRRRAVRPCGLAGPPPRPRCRAAPCRPGPSAPPPAWPNGCIVARSSPGPPACSSSPWPWGRWRTPSRTCSRTTPHWPVGST